MGKFYSFFSIHKINGIEKKFLVLGMAGHSLEEAMVTLQKALVKSNFYNLETIQDCKQTKICIMEFNSPEDEGKEVFHLTIKLEKA